MKLFEAVYVCAQGRAGQRRREPVGLGLRGFVLGSGCTGQMPRDLRNVDFGSGRGHRRFYRRLVSQHLLPCSNARRRKVLSYPLLPRRPVLRADHLLHPAVYFFPRRTAFRVMNHTPRDQLGQRPFAGGFPNAARGLCNAFVVRGLARLGQARGFPRQQPREHRRDGVDVGGMKGRTRHRLGRGPWRRMGFVGAQSQP